MNKAVLLSLRPRWCAEILNGNKIIEIRKNRPKLETPFKCYIYCTKPNTVNPWQLLEIHNKEKIHRANGKVIAEFVCDNIIEMNRRGFDNNFDYCFLSLNVFGNDEIEPYITAVKKSCLSNDEMSEYAGNAHCLYGWSISNLKIYDTPKKLSEFGKVKAPQSWCYVSEEKE